MDVKLSAPKLRGTVKAIASKSHAHRLFICAALAEEGSHITCAESSEDISATVACLTSLGAEIERRNDVYYVNLTLNEKPKSASLDCGESGSTLRFLLPVACALGCDATFQMHGRLPSRPMTELIGALRTHGVKISGEGTPVLRSEGQLKSGIFELPGDISSQYISGLLFALPLLEGDSEIRLTSPLESLPYIQMTLDALSQFGIKITPYIGDSTLNIRPRLHPAVGDGVLDVPPPQVFKISGNQVYRTPKNITVEGDWSNAAFWLCAGAIGENTVECYGLNRNSLQGDSEIVGLLERFGASIKRTETGITVSGGALRGIEIDASNTPDLVPILALVASVAAGKTVIYNAARLRIKESDRLRTVTETLSTLGADITETADGLIINGKPRLNGGTVSSHGDHRIAMMSAVAASVCTGDVIIKDADAVNKSYPNFFKDFAALSGEKTI